MKITIDNRFLSSFESSYVLFHHLQCGLGLFFWEEHKSREKADKLCAFVLCKFLFGICLCSYVWTCACLCCYSWGPKEGVGSPGAGAIGNYKLPDVDAGNWTRDPPLPCKNNIWATEGRNRGVCFPAHHGHFLPSSTPSLFGTVLVWKWNIFAKVHEFQASPLRQ